MTNKDRMSVVKCALASGQARTFIRNFGDWVRPENIRWVEVGMMEYEFVRKLAKGVPEELIPGIVTALSEGGVEVYALDAGAVEAGDEGRYPEYGATATRQEGAAYSGRQGEEEQDCVRYVSADASAWFPNGDIYVPAADRERATELLEHVGALQYLCEDPVESLELTEAEKLQADMIRRHRRNMVICLAVIVLAAIYYAFF